MLSTGSRIANGLALILVGALLLGSYIYPLSQAMFPLDLLQRLALTGAGFGFLINLQRNSRADYRIVLISSLYGTAVAIKQILLYLSPATHGYGATVLGLHLYTWSAVLFCLTILFITVGLLNRDRLIPIALQTVNKQTYSFAAISAFLVSIITIILSALFVGGIWSLASIII